MGEWKDLYTAAKEAYKRKDYQEALKYLERVTDDGDFADVYNLIGLVKHELGDYQGAIDAFNKAVKINPNYLEALLNLSICYNDIGEYRKAQEVYSRARKAHPERFNTSLDPFVRGKLANMYADIGKMYYKIGLPEEAIKEFEKALHLRPDLVDVKVQLGIAYRDIRRFDEAVRELEEAKRLNRFYLPAALNLGMAYHLMGDNEKAIEEWKEVLSLDPQNERAKMYLKCVDSKT